VLAFKAARGNAETYFSVNYTVLKSNVAEIGEAVDLWERYGFDCIGFIAMQVRDPSMQAEALDAVQSEVRRELYAAAERVIAAPYRIAIGSSLFTESEFGRRHPQNVHGNLVVSNHPDAVRPFNCRPYFQDGDYPGVPVRCRAPYKHVRILFNGQVMLCNQHSIGSIYHEPLAALWVGVGAARIRGMVARNELCPSCDYYKFCIRAASVQPFQS
jgi:hypothetical protein